MCFFNEDDGDSWIQRPTPRRARKSRRCDDCSGYVVPGTIYERGVSVCRPGGPPYLSIRCARCVRIAKVIYDREIAEGCAPYESHAPYGGNSIEEYCVSRELGFDDDRGELVDGTLLVKWIAWMDLLFLPDDEDELPAVPA